MGSQVQTQAAKASSVSVSLHLARQSHRAKPWSRNTGPRAALGGGNETGEGAEELLRQRCEAGEKWGSGHDGVTGGLCWVAVPSPQPGLGQFRVFLGFSVLQQERCSAGPPLLLPQPCGTATMGTAGSCIPQCPHLLSVALAGFLVHLSGFGGSAPLLV